MAKAAPYVFLGLSILFFLFLVGLTGFRIETTRQADTALAESRTRELLELAKTLADSSGGFQSPHFKQKMREIFSEEPRLLLLTVHSPTDGILYLITRNKSYVKEPMEITAGWRGVPIYQVSPGYEMLFTQSFPAPEDTTKLDALFVIFGREDLYPIVRDDLYLVLAFLIVCGIFILIAAASSEGNAGSARGYPAAPPWPAPPSVYVPPAPPSAPPAAPDMGPASPQNFRAGTAPDSASHDDWPPWGPHEPSADGRPAAEAAPAPVLESAPEEVEPEQELPKEVEAYPKSLVSPVSGLVWAEHFEARLVNEIQRAAASDEDLTVAILEIDNPPGPRELPAVYAGIAGLLKNEFPLHDLIFESGGTGYALILAETDVDQAVRALEGVRKKAADTELAGKKRTLSIGASSRGGRLIDGPILREEALVSVRKAASEGGNRVIGFKADPAKFREALSGLEG